MTQQDLFDPMSADYKTDHVEVYRNLHNGKLSVRCAKYKRVLGWCDEIVLRNAEFKVSEAGRKRVVTERKKNVHAFAKGFVLGIKGFTSRNGKGVITPNKIFADLPDPVAVTYNPYKYESFVRLEDEQPIYHAYRATVTPKAITAHMQYNKG